MPAPAAVTLLLPQTLVEGGQPPPRLKAPTHKSNVVDEVEEEPPAAPFAGPAEPTSSPSAAKRLKPTSEDAEKVVRLWWAASFIISFANVCATLKDTPPSQLLPSFSRANDLHSALSIVEEASSHIGGARSSAIQEVHHEPVTPSSQG